MAERLESPQREGEVTRKHNMTERAEAIRKHRADILKIEAKLDEPLGTVKSLRKQISDIYRKLKNDCEISRKDAGRAFDLMDLEDEVQETALDTIREIFAACRQGEQVDFLARTEPTQPPGSKAAGAKRNSKKKA